jgi:hypothetical protein
MAMVILWNPMIEEKRFQKKVPIIDSGTHGVNRRFLRQNAGVWREGKMALFSRNSRTTRRSEKKPIHCPLIAR